MNTHLCQQDTPPTPRCRRRRRSIYVSDLIGIFRCDINKYFNKKKIIITRPYIKVYLFICLNKKVNEHNSDLMVSWSRNTPGLICDTGPTVRLTIPLVVWWVQQSFSVDTH